MALAGEAGLVEMVAAMCGGWPEGAAGGGTGGRSDATSDLEEDATNAFSKDRAATVQDLTEARVGFQGGPKRTFRSLAWSVVLRFWVVIFFGFCSM